METPLLALIGILNVMEILYNLALQIARPILVEQTYTWNFDDGGGDLLDASLVSTQDFQFSGPGVYDVQFLVSTTSGCIDSLTQQVRIHPFKSPYCNIPLLN